MKTRLFALLSFLLTVSITGAAYAQETFSVKKVKSGTTFTISSGETIELLGVDAPNSELVSSTDALNFLKQMLSGTEVVLVADSSTSDPATGPKPRYVYLSDGRMVNLRMIVAGYGTSTLLPTHPMSKEFLMAEKTVKAMEAGNVEAAISLENIIPDVVSMIPDLFSGSGKNGGNKSGAQKTGEGKTKKPKATAQKNSQQEENQEESYEQERSSSGSVQCSGTTKKGLRCKNRTTNSSGRCHHHD